MAPPNLVARNAAGTSNLGTVTFTGVDPGTTSAPVAFRLFNDNTLGPVDVADNPRIGARALDPLSGEAKVSGLRAVDERWIQMRALGTGSAGSKQAATGWTPIGRGRFLELAPLPGGDHHNLEVRFAPPSTAPNGQTQFLFDADADSRITAVEQGHTESDGPDGVLSGFGDGTVSEVILDGEPKESVIPDSQVNFPDLVWTHQGVPKVKLAHAITIDENDGSAVALGAGEGYWAVLSLGASGSVVVTKGNKAPTPLDEATLPATPAGEIFYAFLERQQGAINQADITLVSEPGRWAFASTGLNVTIGPGRARVDNSLVRNSVSSALSVPALTLGIKVWLLPDRDGILEVTTDGSRPDPRALLLWEFDTDAVGVVAATLVDRREYIGTRIHLLSVPLDVGAASPQDQRMYTGVRTGYFRPIDGIMVGVRSFGTATAGDYRVDILKSNGLGTYTTIYTSFGTDDRRLSGAFGDTADIKRGTLPEVLPLTGPTMIRAQVVIGTPFSGGTPPLIEVLMLVEEI